MGILDFIKDVFTIGPFFVMIAMVLVVFIVILKKQNMLWRFSFYAYILPTSVINPFIMLYYPENHLVAMCSGLVWGTYIVFATKYILCYYAIEKQKKFPIFFGQLPTSMLMTGMLIYLFVSDSIVSSKIDVIIGFILSLIIGNIIFYSLIKFKTNKLIEKYGNDILNKLSSI